VVAVVKISSKYVGIIYSLATRRALSIPKFLKCINKAQVEPEPCYEKTQLWSRSHVINKHSSGAGAMLTKTESSRAGARAISF